MTSEISSQIAALTKSVPPAGRKLPTRKSMDALISERMADIAGQITAAAPASRS